MKICTFFGHRDAEESIRPKLRQAIIEVIEKDEVRYFYVGSQGRFDGMVLSILKELAPIYGIGYEVVLAYLGKAEVLKNVPTIFPDGQEYCLPRFAIDRRNRWMVEQCDYVISYTYKIAGGAVKFTRYAEKKGKVVIKI